MYPGREHDHKRHLLDMGGVNTQLRDRGWSRALTQNLCPRNTCDPTGLGRTDHRNIRLYSGACACLPRRTLLGSSSSGGRPVPLPGTPLGGTDAGLGAEGRRS